MSLPTPQSRPTPSLPDYRIVSARVVAASYRSARCLFSFGIQKGLLDSAVDSALGSS